MSSEPCLGSYGSSGVSRSSLIFLKREILTLKRSRDGLDFKLLQKNDGERELQASWKGEEITDMSDLVTLLRLEMLWDVFELRAITLLQDRVERQLLRLEGSKISVDELLTTVEVDDDIGESAMHLRELEEKLLLHAYADFEAKVFWSSTRKKCIITNKLMARNHDYSCQQWFSSILAAPLPKIPPRPKTTFLEERRRNHFLFRRTFGQVSWLMTLDRWRSALLQQHPLVSKEC